MASYTDSAANIFLRALLVFVFFLVQVRPATIDYHIAAVEIKWDYAPSGYNQLNGKLLDEDRYNNLDMFTTRYFKIRLDNATLVLV